MKIDICILDKVRVAIFKVAFALDDIDRRRVAARRRAVRHYLEQITDDTSKQFEIWNIVEEQMWTSTEDIAEKLKQKGYEVLQ